MDSKSDNVEIIMGIETDHIIEELFRSFLKNYQKTLEEKMKDSNLFLKVLICSITVFISNLKKG